jgi:hypothetical protein
MTEEPKLIIPEGTLKINQPNWYKVDVEKLHYQRMEDVAYLFATMMVAEDYEHFDKVKKYLIIPEKPKTLEELQQELDEKFDKLIEKTHLEYRIGHNWTYKLRKYDEFCKRQDADFEYAKTHGFFPQITFLDSSKFSISSKFDISSPTFMVKNGNNHQGYYTIGDGYYKFYMEKKPNRVFRFFVYKLMGFKWIDEVLK